MPLGAGSATEVDRWFAEPLLNRKASPEEQQAYMQSKVYDFPIITQMARDFQAIPATSAPSERIFSQAGNLVSKIKARIISENIRYVLCLRSWGLLPPGENDDNNTKEEDDSPLVDDEGRVIQRQEEPAIDPELIN